MKLRSKVILAIILCWAIILGGTYYGAIKILERSYSTLEDKRIHNNLVLVAEAIGNLKAQNNAIIASWFNWDLLYEYMATTPTERNLYQNINFFQDLITPGALQSSNVDLYLIFDNDGNLTYGKTFNNDKTALVDPLPQTLQLFQPKGELRNLIIPSHDSSGLILTQKGILVLSAHRVLPTVGEGISRGTGIIGTYLTNAMWNKLSTESKLNLTLYPLSSTNQIEENYKILDEVLKNTFYKINIDHNTLDLYTLLRDINEKPIALIKVEAKRNIHQLGLQTIHYFNFSFIVIGIVFALILFYQLSYLVISRLDKIKNTITKTILSKDFNLKIPEKGNDEITLLTKETNNLLFAVNESESFLNDIINFMPSIILIVNDQFRILNLNELALKELNLKRAQALNQYLFDLFPFLSPYKSSFEISLSTKTLQTINNILDVDNNQNKKYYHAIIYPLKKSEESSLTIRLDNVTEYMQIEASLIEHDRLSAIGVLTAGVAHEINNPVNFITSSINPLKKDLEILQNLWKNFQEIKNNKSARLSDKITEINKMKKNLDYDFTVQEITQLLDGTTEGIQRTFDITEDLKSYTNKEKINFKKIDIEKSIDATLALLKPSFKNKIIITKNYGNIPKIDGMHTQLNQVFMNILSNAIDAIFPKFGEITIKTLREGNNIKVFIKDNGIGINDANITKIFDPFFTTKNVGQGTGLGLSITLSIIREHGGTIEVLSKDGKGAEFIVTLPIIHPRTTVEKSKPQNTTLPS
ncbi:MAG TPA: ATP-binding protein [Gammaproteobacteria bacterium]|jgi:signal transduction histidine kinase|nr:ATP-binding protein [Gammaproteobacteria bacterium]